MSDPFLSEIKITAFGFPPKGWAACNGQLMPIAQNQALFSLLGTMYGGDGRITFGLPNLQGRTPLHVGNGIGLAAQGGEAAHTLSTDELPQHTHSLQGTATAADAETPGGNLLGGATVYGPSSNPTTLNPGTVGYAGGGQPHNNMQPYLVLNFSIALQGIYPTRN